MEFFCKKIFVLLLIIGFNELYAQTPKRIKPEIGISFNFSKKEQLIWQNALEQYSKLVSGDIDETTLSIKDKNRIDSLEQGYGPMTQGMDCSWYCGGQMYKVTSNSYLKEQGNINYKPSNVHDFDLFTAWVPDTLNGVIGKKINFHFKPLSPRVNEIIIYNGYIKNRELFESNARVKKFKLYINKVLYAVLELDDTTASQSFKIDAVQSKEKNKDLVLTLEIIEIYKGTKYADVAVSEINFNGIDVH